MELLEKLRAAVRELRPAQNAAGPRLVSGNVTVAGDGGGELEIEDLQALATSARRRGYLAGREEAGQEALARVELVRRHVAREAETVGVLAGLDVAISEIADAVESNEGRNEGPSRVEILERLEWARGRVAEEGMHGERSMGAGVRVGEVA